MPPVRPTGRQTARSSVPYPQAERSPSKRNNIRSGKGRKFDSENEVTDTSLTFTTSIARYGPTDTKYSQAGILPNHPICSANKRTTAPLSPQEGPKVAPNANGTNPLLPSIAGNGAFRPIAAKTLSVEAPIILPKSLPGHEQLHGNYSPSEITPPGAVNPIQRSYNPPRGSLVMSLSMEELGRLPNSGRKKRGTEPSRDPVVVRARMLKPKIQKQS